MQKFFIFTAFIVLGLASPVFAQVPQNSIYYEYYEDGKVKLAIPLVGDVLQGEGKMYYPDGTVMAEVVLENNEVVRVNAYYDQQGNLANGRQKYFDEAGRLLFEGTFVKGKPNGEAVHYNPDGTVNYKVLYNMGEVVEKKVSTQPSLPKVSQ